MKTPTASLKKKIQTYVKNGMDISDLIDGVNIKGMDLGRSRIKRLNIVGQNISGTNFANAIIGEENNTVIISGCNVRNCSFQGAKVLGKFLFRKNDARGCIFREAWLPFAEYQHTDFRQCSWCDCVIRIGARAGCGAKFDRGLFRELTKYWNVSVAVNGENVTDGPTSDIETT